MLELAIIYDSVSACSSPEVACRDSDRDNRLGTPELVLPVPSDGSVNAGGSEEEDPMRWRTVGASAVGDAARP